jgi:hypothetical protein
VNILQHTDPLPGNDRETNNETTAVAMQRAARNNESTVGIGVSYVVRSEAISRDRRNLVQFCSALLCSALGQFGRRLPCGGGFEYLHRDPASRRRRRKGKSQI